MTFVDITILEKDLIFIYCHETANKYWQLKTVKSKMLNCVANTRQLVEKISLIYDVYESPGSNHIAITIRLSITGKSFFLTFSADRCVMIIVLP